MVCRARHRVPAQGEAQGQARRREAAAPYRPDNRRSGLFQGAPQRRQDLGTALGALPADGAQRVRGSGQAREFRAAAHAGAGEDARPAARVAYPQRRLGVLQGRQGYAGRAERGSCQLRPRSIPQALRGPPHDDRAAPCAGALDRQPRESPLHPLHRQSHLAIPFRAGLGRERQQPRQDGQEAHAPRTARLAGAEIRPRRLVTETDAPPADDIGSVPARRPAGRPRRGCPARPEQRPAQLLQAAAADRRGASRFDAGRLR